VLCWSENETELQQLLGLNRSQCGKRFSGRSFEALETDLNASVASPKSLTYFGIGFFRIPPLKKRAKGDLE
jgi:hypothetical protein